MEDSKLKELQKRLLSTFEAYCNARMLYTVGKNGFKYYPEFELYKNELYLKDSPNIYLIFGVKESFVEVKRHYDDCLEVHFSSPQYQFNRAMPYLFGRCNKNPRVYSLLK